MPLDKQSTAQSAEHVETAQVAEVGVSHYISGYTQDGHSPHIVALADALRALSPQERAALASALGKSGTPTHGD